MSDERVDLGAIRARAEKATPGPWRNEPHSNGNSRIWAGDLNWIADVSRDVGAFIAHARTDIPALLEEVDRLRAQNARLLTHNVDAIQTSVEALKFSEDMRAEGRREGLQRAAELCRAADISGEGMEMAREAIEAELKGGGT